MRNIVTFMLLAASAAFSQTAAGVIGGQLSSPAPAGVIPAGPSIVITVTKLDGSQVTERISGVPAVAGLEVLDKWMATQTNAEGKPRYENAADLVKSNLIDVIQRIVDQGFASSQTEAELKAIEAKIAEIKAKRAALFEAARKQ